MIRFVVITDLHYDYIHDGDRRINELISKIKSEHIDFVISLGDLCHPIEENKKIIDKLNSVGVPVYHTMGNHDSDEYLQETVLKFTGMKNGYYSFIIGHTKFIVLNTCYIKNGDGCLPYYKRNYNKKQDIYPFVPEIEREWLLQEIQNEELNYVVFSHHSLSNNFQQRGVANRNEIRNILEHRKVILCMNGHDHGDDCSVINGIPYYTVNSMSYIWHGTKSIFSYSDEIHKRYPFLKDMILYEEPLHAIVEIDNNHVRVIGMEGHYQTISPEDIGIGITWNGVSIAPKISSFEM